MNEQFPPIYEKEKLPDKPQVTLHFKDMGILCMNDNVGRAEIGYMKLPGHGIEMQIIETDLNTGKSKHLIKPAQQSMNGQELVIRTKSGGMGTVYQKGSGDRKSFEYALDLSELYTKNFKWKTFTVNPFQTKIYLHEAVFFAQEGTIRNISAFNQNDPTEFKFPKKEKSMALSAIIESDVVEIRFGNASGDVFKKTSFSKDKTYCVNIGAGQCLSTESDVKYAFELLDGASKPYNLSYVSPQPAKPLYNKCAFKQLIQLAEDLQPFTQLESIDELLDSDEFDHVSIGNAMKLLYPFECEPAPCSDLAALDEPRSLP